MSTMSKYRIKIWNNHSITKGQVRAKPGINAKGQVRAKPGINAKGQVRAKPGINLE